MDLQQNFNELFNSIQSNDSEAYENANTLISNIRDICQNQYSSYENDIDYICDLVFNDKKGLLKILKISRERTDLTELKVCAFEILQSFLIRFPSKIKCHAPEIKDISLMYFLRDNISKVRSAAGVLLYELLKITSNNADDLDIPNVAKKLFELLASKSKLQATYTFHLYLLYGVLFEFYPECMYNYSEKLFVTLLRSLEKEITSKTKKPENLVISGCFHGLNHFLVNFPIPDEPSTKKIYDYTLSVIDIDAKVAKYDFIKAALLLLSKHIYLFRKSAIVDYQKIYFRLHSWSNHKNPEVRHEASSTLYSFIEFIAKELVDSNLDNNEKESLSILSFFLKKFKKTLSDTEVSNKQISLAIKGYGLLAKPCKLIISENELFEIFNEVMQYGNSFFNQDNIKDTVIGLPTYLETLSHIVCYVSELSESSLITLAKNILILIERFPHMPEKMHYSAQLSLSSVILSLAGNGSVFKNFLSDIIYQGLIRTCSHPLQQPENEKPEKINDNIDYVIAQDKISYKSYIILWKGFLNVANTKNDITKKLNKTDKYSLTCVIYNELIQSILKIVSKLNLKLISEESSYDDPNETIVLNTDDSVTAENPKDLIILTNLVEFSMELLVNNHVNLFERWIYIFSDAIIGYCTKYPLVSPLYKFLAMSSKISTNLFYFKNIENFIDRKDDATMDTDEKNTSEKWACFILLMKFAKEILMKLKQFKDDLLIACLQFIIELSVEIINNDIELYIPAIQSTFSLGLSYIPLANSGVETLERLTNGLSNDKWYPALRKILPILNKYLSTSSNTSDVQEVVTLVSERSKRSRKKFSIKVIKKRNQLERLQYVKSETTMEEVRYRIVKFLGKIGNFINYFLIDDDSIDGENELESWDTRKYLKFPLPFVDVKPSIYLDSFLPRVSFLAQNSSDRKTKVTCCELLHAMVLFILGRSSQESTEYKSSFNKLYRRLFPAIVNLSCDIESVANQLFKPLLNQLIHWFTKSSVEPKDANELLTALKNAVVQPKNSALRQAGADGIQEFIKWSIKQTTKAELEKKPQSIENVLNQIFEMSIHPNTFHRYGAAMIFNSIYRIYREEEYLVDVFTFKLLACFIESLCLGHDDEKALGTEEQCKVALKHIERIIVEKANVLSKPSQGRNRLKPIHWNEASMDVAVRWLLRQCGKPYAEARHMSMKLIFELSCHVTASLKSARDYIRILYKSKGIVYFIERFEYDALEGNGIATIPCLFDGQDLFELSYVLNWFEKFLAALDCYLWVLDVQFFNSTELFTETNIEKPSKLFKVIQHFIENIAYNDIQSINEQFKIPSDDIFTVKEISQFNESKCTVIVRLMNLLSSMCILDSKNSGKIIAENILSDKFSTLFFICLLNPKYVGFDTADIQIIKKLPVEVTNYIRKLLVHLPSEKIMDFKFTLSALLKKENNLVIFENLPDNLHDDNCEHVSLLTLINGYECLHSLKLLETVTIADEFCRYLSKYVYERLLNKTGDKLMVKTLKPLTEDVFKGFLRLSLIINSEIVLEKLYIEDEIFNNASQVIATTSGSAFYFSFQSTINEFLSADFTIVKRIIRWAISDDLKEKSLFVCIFKSLLDYIVREKKKVCGYDTILIIKEAGFVLHSLLSKWKFIDCWFKPNCLEENKEIVISFVEKILLIDSKPIMNVKFEHFSTFHQIYLKLLSTNNNYTTKAKLLDLLLFFVDVPYPNRKLLEDGLNDFVNTNFPLRSTEFDAGSQKYIQYIGLVKKLLYTLSLTGNEMLLKLIISFMCREKEHACEDTFQNELINMMKFTKKKTNHQLSLCEIPFNIFVNESFSPEIRLSTIERVNLCLLRNASKEVILLFFEKWIGKLTEIIESKQLKTDSQLVYKIGAYKLLEVLYAVLSEKDVCNPGSKLNDSYCRTRNVETNTGKELTKLLLKCANATKSEDINLESNFLDLRRKYCRSAYNCMIAIVACTQKDIKFYNGFLFSGNYLFENIIDTTIEYEFELEMDKLFSRKEKFVAVRTAARKDDMDEKSGGNFTKINYLASQYLADSSLNAEASHYDFSHSFYSQSFSSSSVNELNLSKTSSSSKKDDTNMDAERSEQTINMEMDALNEHECMPSLTGLMKHMYDNGISPKTFQQTSPTWVSNLLKKMKDPSVHTNIKLFIAKLIVNSRDTFEPFAKDWYETLIDLIINDKIGKGGTSALNYFVIDLIVTMLSWHKIAVPGGNVSEKLMASKLLFFLMENCHHETRSILRNNLEVLKTLFEVWRGCFDIKYSIIYRLLSAKTPDSRTRQMTGLQVLGVIVANGFSPFEESHQTNKITKNMYFEAIYNCLTMKSKTEYSSAAEVIGMCLNYFQTHNENAKWIEEQENTICEKLNGIKKVKVYQFITIGYKMQLHYKKISERLNKQVLFIIPNVSGELLEYCLEIIHGCARNIDSPFIELKEILISSLDNRDDGCQLSALRVLKELTLILNDEEILYFLPSLANFVNSKTSACRQVMYSIFITLYDRFCDLDNDNVQKIISFSKDTLLQGLQDEDVELRILVQNFWSDEKRLPALTIDRTISMLKAMYSPKTEQQYLCYATNLLLEMTSKSPDFNREIFEKPLSHCTFKNVNVNHSWRHRNLMTSTLLQGSQMASLMENMDDDFIRATQAPQFSETIDPKKMKRPYNWLTQSSIDTFADYSESSQHSQSQSSLLFIKYQGYNKTKKPSNVSKVSNTKELEKDEDTDNILRLRRRFIKDNQNTQLHFVKQQIRKRNFLREKELERKEKRENEVTMYRKYRAGDLPDIQIKYSCIIAPLQAAAQRDAHLARLLFTQLFSALMNEMENSKSDVDEIRRFISNSIEAIISASNCYYPPLFGAILDIVRLNLHLTDIDCSKIAEACIGSDQIALGILILEDIIVRNSSNSSSSSSSTDMSKAKKARISYSINDKAWVELAKLYKSIKDFDTLQGIFKFHIKSDSKTSDALALEAKGDFSSAIDIYNEQLSRNVWKFEPEEVEKDLWDESRLQCYNNLCNWDKINEITVETIKNSDNNGLHNIWIDTYYQDYYLPLLIKSKVKRLQSGINEEELFKFIDESFQVDSRREILEAKYSQELSLMFINQQEYTRANHYVTIAIDQFLNEWSSMGSIENASKMGKLKSLQKLCEIQEFLDVLKNNNGKDICVKKILALNDIWTNRRLNDVFDTQDVWDDIMTNRAMFLNCFGESCKELRESALSINQIMIGKTKFRLAQANSAKLQNNFTLAESLLNEIKNTVKKLGVGSLVFNWTEIKVDIFINKSNNTDLIDKLKIDLLEKSLLEQESVTKLIRLEEFQKRKMSLLKAKIFNKFYDMFDKERYDRLDQFDIKRLKKISGCVDNEYNKIKLYIEKKTFNIYEKALSMSTTDNQTASDSYLQLAIFCDKLLLNYEESDDDNNDDNDDNKDWLIECAGKFIMSLCKALEMGNTKAIYRFARLLQLVEKYPLHSDLFIQKTKHIPCWMFLSWLGQMTALLDKKISCIVHEPLLKIAEIYPNALVYPFTLSRESYVFEKSTDGEKASMVCKKIDKLLNRNPYIKPFVKSLAQFEQPNMFITERLTDIYKKDNKKENYLNFLKDLFNQYPDSDESSLYSSKSVTLPSEVALTAKIGPYRERFLKKFKCKLDKLYGKNGELISSVRSKDLLALSSELKSAENDFKPPKDLNEYSDWLSNFKGIKLKYGYSIELPGQYDGFKKPIPEHHVKISSIGTNVMVMSSLRKPKVVSFYGTNAKEYKMLVKTGEDLRLDQRILQTFNLMNKIVREDCQCSKRNLQLKTYNVIPLTTRVGLIEWMDNTVPIKDFFVSALSDYTLLRKVQKEYNDWVYNDAGEPIKPGNPLGYHLNLQVRESSEIVKAFKNFQAKIPRDLSRKAYLNMSASSEAFFILKQNFAKSNAQMCVYLYILGIGDRHLSNTMIDKNNGATVPIDFGYAFGVGTQILPIPELVPFRLTRQFENLMLPHKSKGIFRATMSHVLNAIRLNKDLLLSSLDVFIKEPCIDLKNQEERLKRNSNDMNMMDLRNNSLPKLKVIQVKKKLLGFNPAFITKADLENSLLKKSEDAILKKTGKKVVVTTKENYIKLAVNEGSTRWKLGEKYLCVDDQVEALIDMATDKNVLGVAFSGWEAYV